MGNITNFIEIGKSLQGEIIFFKGENHLQTGSRSQMEVQRNPPRHESQEEIHSVLPGRAKENRCLRPGFIGRLGRNCRF